MGSDKAQIRLLPDGPTLLEAVIAVATSLSTDVMVVGRPSLLPNRSHIRSISDRHPGQGPLGGIIAALEHCRFDRCLVLPCDAPFLSIAVLRWMQSLDLDADAVIPQTEVQTRQGGEKTYQTLHAVYKRSCCGPMLESLEAGRGRTTDWIKSAVIQTISEREIRKRDPEMLTFFSVNTPQDLERARSIAQQRLSGSKTGASGWHAL